MNLEEHSIHGFGESASFERAGVGHFWKSSGRRLDTRLRSVFGYMGGFRALRLE